jgi:hypothetical protein
MRTHWLGYSRGWAQRYQGYLGSSPDPRISRIRTSAAFAAQAAIHERQQIKLECFALLNAHVSEIKRIYRFYLSRSMYSTRRRSRVPRD